ncbi:MAG: hypothetical protein DME02_01115 [Candidatus Rokuibacteriota bacterium]|nr:MAG: hypothetical protein DME02_01115 [Candidatus Rokubacteria bacterium]
MRVRRLLMTTALVLAYLVSMGTPASPAPQDGTLTIGVHVTLVNRWLDPGETEALITPFMVLYALHDALVKPMPKNIMTPSLAESWTASKDGLSYDFVIRKNAKFHNGDPVTAEDVKFTFERYKGASAKILKDHVKEIQLPAPNRVRFVLQAAWPDFMAFYGTSATGAGWIVPKKYIEKVGEDGFKKAPVGAGPYKFVSFQPGVELVQTGEVDLAYLFTGPAAEELKRSPGVRIVAPVLYGMYWLDFPDQWDPKSPWHDKRVRMAANLVIDRKGINQSEMLGLGKLASSNIPPEFDFALKLEPPAYDPKRAKQLMVEAGYANGFDTGDLTPLPPYTTLAESVAGMLQSIGIRSHVRAMERATFLTTWREKKLHGLILPATGAAGNAAARIEPFFTKNGFYAYGSMPEIDDLFERQAKELDRKQREALLHQIQKLIADNVLIAPIFQQAFIWGVSARVAEPAAGLIEGYPYIGPAEDLKLK